jgi:hypothetical protein
VEFYFQCSSNKACFYRVHEYNKVIFKKKRNTAMNTQTVKLTRLAELQSDLNGLMNGSVKPSSIIGKGYKNPKQVAAQWLRSEMHNESNPNCKVSQVHVTSSGKGFVSESKAMRSKTYKSLLSGEYKLINNAVVTDYGVMPTPDNDSGYMIFVEYKCH